MRPIAVLAICVPVIAAAQVRMGVPPPRFSPPRQVIAQPAGALGGSFASIGISRPLGGIALPGALPVLTPRPRRANGGYR
ncbi:MAG TPA: hypothetical protein VNH18_24095, partial [Bryobacteraceae bacterium]|nr:hypothetical protein [Bryobacteraceae bacterium]